MASERFPASERLRFRAWQSEDRALALALWGDPEVARFIFARPPTEAEIDRRLAREISTQEQHGISYWPIFLADGSHVGCCGLRPKEPHVPELGVHIRPAFWRRGLGAEGARAVIAHAFDVLGAEAIFAGHNPKNEASKQMLEKLGFHFTHCELYPPTGLDHPSYLLTR